MFDFDFPRPDPLMLPDVVLTRGNNPVLEKTQVFTTANLKFVLDAMGITVRYDEMRKRFALVHDAVGLDDDAQDRVYLVLTDTLTRMGIKNHTTLGDALVTLGRFDCFHPMVDWIESAEWDGEDRFEALAASVPTDTELWPTYLRLWLIQTVEAVYGWQAGEQRSLPNVPVFVGGQGAGKGRWLRKLAPQEFVLADGELHLSSTQGKDHQIVTLQHPIVELGEIDATFSKADISTLKSFLSRTKDMIREPYAKKASPRLRATVFFGSVNNFEFLNDPTGTRRFWPIHVTGKITWAHGIDMQQLWAQALTWWEAGDDWNLNDDQDAQRVADSAQFTLASPEADLLEALFVEHGDDWDNYYLANKTEIAKLIGFKEPKKMNVSAVTEYLREHCGPPRTMFEGDLSKQRCWCVPGGPRVTNVPGLIKVSSITAKKYVKWRGRS